MWRVLCLLIVGSLTLFVTSEAQIVKEFKVEQGIGLNAVNFDFSSYKGVSKIKRDPTGFPLMVHAHLSKVNILPSFSHHRDDAVLFTSLSHSNVESENLGKSLSYRLFGSNEGDFDHIWEIGLGSTYLYNLNLNFGIGMANLDFSDLLVSRCKINTASADVNLYYTKKEINATLMDTMMVKINMGTLEANNINYANAETMMFEINYGKVNLGFEEGMAKACDISAIVGAGSVNVVLPSENQPYKVIIKSTPMCRTSVPKYLKNIGNKTYVSKAFKEDAENLMTMRIDVSVGSVTLK
ncbi:hypothetical protein [Pararhodonellum marinum]|uniref:hypothetical protein n=1 Tax=Pararhodonellum marinum TaxID=2755358 RepID=UPI0018902A71|nr:hypothetical protein [Pararhodonellum marinum]